MNDLKPCPCCGCDDWMKRGPTAQGMVAYQCKGCGLQSRFGTESLIVADLNKRYDALAAASTIEKLKEALQICIHGEPDLEQNEWRQVRKIYEST